MGFETKLWAASKNLLFRCVVPGSILRCGDSREKRRQRRSQLSQRLRIRPAKAEEKNLNAPRTKMKQNSLAPPKRRRRGAQRSDSPSKRFEPPPWPPDGRYVTPRALDSDSATSFAASMRLTSIRPVPHSSRALLIISAAAASPSARMTLAFFSCSAFATM